MLNAKQKQAVSQTEGRVLILAGAGSGKTTVLIHRIKHILSKGVPPEQILGLTFTNKAAEEMRSRLKHPEAKKVTLCTFHSFCMNVLRKEIHHLGYTNKFSLYDEADVGRLVKQINANEEVPLEETALNRRLSDCMRAYNAVDFDTLLTLTVQLFDEFPDVKERYQYAYVMIDEYQDTNGPQFELATHISEKHKNICVVGDDDQAIYGWRGAEVRHILGFGAEHTIKLEQNYRSHPLILKAANTTIANNTQRHDKNLFSTRPNGSPIEIFTAPTDKDEAEAVISRIITKSQNYALGDMAILYRSNILARPFEKMLLTRKIPYQVFGGLELYSRGEIKDVIAYLRAIINPQDNEALLRIINYPRRGISDKTLDQLTRYQRSHNMPLFEVLKNPPDTITEHGKKGLESFVMLMNHARQKFEVEPPHEALSYFIDMINLKETLTQEFKSEAMRDIKWQNILETVEILKSFDDVHEFLTASTLDMNQPRKKERSKDKVNLMTLHSAKGLEFPVCFIAGLEENYLPHEKCHSLEEERRLFYVGITRAKEQLILSMAKKRSRYGKERPTIPSPFLHELPRETLQVTHWNV